MPTYEYACPTCGIVEAFQSIRDAALTTCPQCEKSPVTRMVSLGGGVIFKGSGFWETDYNRSKDYKDKTKDAAKPATPAPVEAPPVPQTKAQAKPEKAPPTEAKPASTAKPPKSK